MIRVLRHGNSISVQNPVTGEWNNMINVTFIEEGRGGADKGMSETTAFLESITGDAGVGLNQVRIHTHPVMADKIGLFPVGQEFPGHINRGLFSTPQIRQQVDKDARIVDGKPTYFKTWISAKPEEDSDMRMDNNILAQVKPSTMFASNVQAANVRILQTAAEAGRFANPSGFTAQHNAETQAPGTAFTEGMGEFGRGQTGADRNTPQGGTREDQRSNEQRDFPQ
jgi:hypothetical protein